MITEILIVLLIIIALILFLVFFKTWNIHLIFKNHNLRYDYILKISFLTFQIKITNKHNQNRLEIYFITNKHEKNIISLNFNNKKENKDQNTIDEKEKNLFLKIKEITPLLLESKETLYEIIKLTTKIIQFQNSNSQITIGLKDNNLTIKLCNMIWALTAPLYILNLQVVLTPKINEYVLTTYNDIKLTVKLVHLLKIILIILKNNKLHKIIKIALR